jgi:hypothetical protein
VPSDVASRAESDVASASAGHSTDDIPRDDGSPKQPVGICVMARLHPGRVAQSATVIVPAPRRAMRSFRVMERLCRRERGARSAERISEGKGEGPSPGGERRISPARRLLLR